MLQDHIDELPSEDPIASSLDRRNEQEDLLPKSDSRVSTGSVASSIESGRSIMKESLTSKNSNVAEVSFPSTAYSWTCPLVSLLRPEIPMSECQTYRSGFLACDSYRVAALFDKSAIMYLSLKSAFPSNAGKINLKNSIMTWQGAKPCVPDPHKLLL